jgi:paraquat-inducible protein A
MITIVALYIRAMLAGISLHAENAWRSRIWLGLLGVALSLQVLALVLPFMQVDIFMKGSETFSLLRTVKLMWDEGLWGIAVLITGFSVIFPFVKIALLLRAWLWMRPGPSRTHLLEWLGRLGKWSMLDPFSVLVLVLLASDQWAVTATTNLGVYAFLTAVAITMWLSIAATHLDTTRIREHEHRDHRRQSLARRSGWWGVAALMSIAMAMVCFGLALNVPFLRINQFLLSDEAYGVLKVPLTMLHERNWPLAFLSLVCLIVMPAVVLLAELAAWLVPARPRMHLWRRRWIALAREWCMLDVMGLALGLFLAEGQKFIRTDVEHGLWLLVVAALSLWLSGWILARATEAGVRRMDAAA